VTRLSSELRNRVKKGRVMLSVRDRNWLRPVPTILLNTYAANTPSRQQSTISHSIIHAHRFCPSAWSASVSEPADVWRSVRWNVRWMEDVQPWRNYSEAHGRSYDHSDWPVDRPTGLAPTAVTALFAGRPIDAVYDPSRSFPSSVVYVVPPSWWRSWPYNILLVTSTIKSYIHFGSKQPLIIMQAIWVIIIIITQMAYSKKNSSDMLYSLLIYILTRTPYCKLKMHQL